MNPCPTCGKQPRVLSSLTSGTSRVACCRTTPPYKHAQDAKKKWREMTRAVEPSPRDSMRRAGIDPDEFGGFDRVIVVQEATPRAKGEALKHASKCRCYVCGPEVKA